MQVRTAVSSIIGLAAIGGAGLAGCAALGADSVPAPSTPDPPAPAATGVRWNPDDRLPSVEPGGAAQADWARALLANYDAVADGALDAADGRAGTGPWGGDTSAMTSVLVARYDLDGDARVDATEATRMGAEHADSAGHLSAAAAAQLRAELGAALRG